MQVARAHHRNMILIGYPFALRSQRSRLIGCHHDCVITVADQTKSLVESDISLDGFDLKARKLFSQNFRKNINFVSTNIASSPE